MFWGRMKFCTCCSNARLLGVAFAWAIEDVEHVGMERAVRTAFFPIAKRVLMLRLGSILGRLTPFFLSC